MATQKTPDAFAKFTLAVRRGVDLRDKRDAALKAAAAALSALEAMVESGVRHRNSERHRRRGGRVRGKGRCTRRARYDDGCCLRRYRDRMLRSGVDRC
jgi:hypothetical protein